MLVALRSSRTRTTLPSRISRTMSSLARSRRVQASQSDFTFRHTRLTTSLPTAPLNNATSARFTRLVNHVFKVKDYRIDGPDRYTTMTLDTSEFIRRFPIHVLPTGFHRIRHYGFLANSSRAEALARARELLAADR
jgi:hypothetical protein